MIGLLIDIVLLLFLVIMAKLTGRGKELKACEASIEKAFERRFVVIGLN